MTFLFVTILAAVAAVSAAPLALVRRCDVPPPNVAVRNQIYQVAKSMGVSDNVMVAMMATAIRESNVNNLNCGDKDSLGVFQQRPSQGWGSADQILDVDFSTRSFLRAAIAADHGQDPGVLAQTVQGAEAGNHYTENEGTARQYIALAAAATGGGAPAPAPAKPASKKPEPASTKKPEPASTEKPEPAASSAPADGADGAANVAPAPTADAPAPSVSASGASDGPGPNNESGAPEDCNAWYQPVPGDTCLGVAAMHNIDLDSFYEMNPCIDDQCQNLQVTFPYCVGRSS